MTDETPETEIPETSVTAEEIIIQAIRDEPNVINAFHAMSTAISTLFNDEVTMARLQKAVLTNPELTFHIASAETGGKHYDAFDATFDDTAVRSLGIDAVKSIIIDMIVADMCYNIFADYIDMRVERSWPYVDAQRFPTSSSVNAMLGRLANGVNSACYENLAGIQQLEPQNPKQESAKQEQINSLAVLSNSIIAAAETAHKMLTNSEVASFNIPSGTA